MATQIWISTSSTDPTVGGNWSSGSEPSSADNIYIVPVPGVTLSNITFSDMSAIVAATLTITAGIQIGTTDATSTNLYGYWCISAGVCTIGTPDGTQGTGSGRIKINLAKAGSPTACLVTIQQTNSNAIDGASVPPVRILASNASTLTMLGGYAGVAVNLPGEVSNVSGGVYHSGGTLDLGPGVTLGNVYVANNATLYSESAITLLSVASGSVANISGTGEVTTINCSGRISHNVRTASGASTATLNLYNNGVCDFTGNPANVTVTTVNQYAGGRTLASPANPGHLSVGTRNLIGCGTLTAS